MKRVWVSDSMAPEVAAISGGVIGNPGTTLGDNNVNITRLHLSRDAREKLRKLTHVVFVTPIKM